MCGSFLSLLCMFYSCTYVLFHSEFLIIFTHYSKVIPMPSPNVPIKLCVIDNDVHNSYSGIAMDLAD